MARIFISYSHVDEQFAKTLAELLRKKYGYENVWYDDRLHSGVKWWDEILGQIKACDVFLYLLSNDSVESRFCQAEFEEATRLQKQFAFVQVRGRTRLTDELGQYQYTDMSERGVDDASALTDLYYSIDVQAKDVRGGSFNSTSNLLRTANRNGGYPGNESFRGGGFRCARSQ